MKKYRIQKITYANGDYEYKLQYRLLYFFWLDVEYSNYYAIDNGLERNNIYLLNYDSCKPKFKDQLQMELMRDWCNKHPNNFIGIEVDTHKVLYLFQKNITTVYGDTDPKIAQELWDIVHKKYLENKIVKKEIVK